MGRTPTSPTARRLPLWVVTSGALATGAALAAALHAATAGHPTPGWGRDAGVTAATLVALTLIAGVTATLLAVLQVAAERRRPGPAVDGAGAPLPAWAFALCTATTVLGVALLLVPSQSLEAHAGLIIVAGAVAAGLVLAVASVEWAMRRIDADDIATTVAAAAVDGIRRRATVPHPDGGVLPRRDPPSQTLASPRRGVVRSVDAVRLARIAAHLDCQIVIPHAVGDPVDAGDTLVEIYGSRHDLQLLALRGTIQVAARRSVTDDPAAALRTLADLAIGALSPAALAPSAAVRVLDRIEEVLDALGAVPLPGAWIVGDDDGTPRVEMPSLTWPDFLALALTEVREYGESSPQVTRRLRALLEELRRTVRPEHHAALDIELAELSSSVRRGFADPVLRRFAGCADRQGIGGAGAAAARVIPSRP